MASNTYSQGSQVEHQKFGLGEVVSHTDERIVIKFDDHGEKKFVTPMVMGQLKKRPAAARTEEGNPQPQESSSRAHGVGAALRGTFV